MASSDEAIINYANFLVSILNDKATHVNKDDNTVYAVLADPDALKKYWELNKSVGRVDYITKERLIKDVIGKALGMDLKYAAWQSAERNHVNIDFYYDRDEDDFAIGFHKIIISIAINRD